MDEASETSYDEDDAVWSYTPTSGPSNISDRQSPTNVKSKHHLTTTPKLEADDFTEKMLKTEAHIGVLADEIQRASDVVTEVTAVKRALSLKIDALEKKITKAYVTMKEVSKELAEAVETMAKETQRLRSTVRKPAIGD